MGIDTVAGRRKIEINHRIRRMINGLGIEELKSEDYVVYEGDIKLHI